MRGEGEGKSEQKRADMADLTKKLLAVTAIGLPSYKLVNGPYPEPVHCASHFKTSSYQLLTVTDLQLTKYYTGPRTWTNPLERPTQGKQI